MDRSKPCGNTTCDYNKRGLCKNKEFKTWEDVVDKCVFRKICSCRVGDVETKKHEVDSEGVLMIVERCAECGITLRSYPKGMANLNDYEKIVKFIDIRFKECVEERKRCDKGNHHYDAIRNEGSERVLCDIRWFIESLKLVNKSINGE